MYPINNKKYIIIPVVFIISIFSVLSLLNIKTILGEPPQHVLAADNQEHEIFIPLVLDHFPITTPFGIQMHRIKPSEGFDMVKDTDSNWIRHNGVLWSEIERIKGTRNWDSMAELEVEVIKASNEGIKVIMIIRSTPDWAQKTPGAYCGPIKDSELDTFGDFVYDVVSRYSQPPYNIKYWEIWNEPDVPYTGTNANSGWGCWGDQNDAYFGGGYFGQMLKAAYPQIKAADPKAKVILGGLLLDCDPRPNSNWCAYWGHDERPPKFLEGILLNGGGNYFDGVAFHGYDYFDFTDPELGEYLNPVWGNSWDGSLYDGTPGNRIGPVTLYKAEYVREILNKYNVSGKFLMNTESALVCGLANDPPGGDGCEADANSLFEQTKARYIPQAYMAAISRELDANTWYTILGWRNSGLLYANLSPRPAYFSFDFAREELADSVYVREISDYQNVKVYEFQRYDIKIWLVWAIDTNTHTITLPDTPDAVYDFMGAEQTPSSTLQVNLDPLYLEWR
jgi:hypothetical protein